jgi:hypothetical protein
LLLLLLQLLLFVSSCFLLQLHMYSLFLLRLLLVALRAPHASNVNAFANCGHCGLHCTALNITA